MTMVRTRARLIRRVEDFRIEVLTRKGRAVNPKRNGVLSGRWPYEKASKDSMTVMEFRLKFRDAYPGYDCNVLTRNRVPARGNMLLRTVRATYP